MNELFLLARETDFLSSSLVKSFGSDVFFFFLTAAAVLLKSPNKNYRDEPTL
jgi:hypothetical protein